MAFQLPSLPYPQDALEPHMTARTLSFHHGKHHAGYVTRLNSLIAGTDLERLALDEIVRTTADAADKRAIFNNAAQVWNHTFFWSCMAPGGGGTPTGELAARIDAAFGGLREFSEKFTGAAANRFGSGWAWLVLDGEELKVVDTPNAETPVSQGTVPLLTVDVWEHAYYLDFQNRRPDFLQTFMEHLVDWSFVAGNLRRAT
ncbi:MAG: superoxide dismutase [Candidatus Latescibacterota bacterium]